MPEIVCFERLGIHIVAGYGFDRKDIRKGRAGKNRKTYEHRQHEQQDMRDMPKRHSGSKAATTRRPSAIRTL